MIQKKFANHIFHIVMLLVFGLIFMLNSGCGSTIKSINMIPGSMESSNQFGNSVTVKVSGEKSVKTTETFKEAVEESLKKYAVFSDVIHKGDANYLLKIEIKELSQPAGFNMEVHLVTSWSLTDLKTQKMIWRDLISSDYIAKLGEAFTGWKRMRIATEGAMRNNIRRGLEELSRIHL